MNIHDKDFTRYNWIFFALQNEVLIELKSCNIFIDCSFIVPSLFFALIHSISFYRRRFDTISIENKCDRFLQERVLGYLIDIVPLTGVTKRAGKPLKMTSTNFWCSNMLFRIQHHCRTWPHTMGICRLDENREKIDGKRFHVTVLCENSFLC